MTMTIAGVWLWLRTATMRMGMRMCSAENFSWCLGIGLAVFLAAVFPHGERSARFFIYLCIFDFRV